MCLEKQNSHQDSGLIDSTWRTSLSLLILLMIIRKLRVSPLSEFLMSLGFQKGIIRYLKNKIPIKIQDSLILLGGHP